jgi:hypothetical protein
MMFASFDGQLPALKLVFFVIDWLISSTGCSLSGTGSAFRGLIYPAPKALEHLLFQVTLIL